MLLISPYSNKIHVTGDTLNGHPKHYPIKNWKILIDIIRKNFPELEIVQVGVYGEEQLPGVDRFISNASMHDLKYLLDNCKAWVSIDNFFPHFAHYYGKQGVAIFIYSNPLLFGYKENINVFKNELFFKPNQFTPWYDCPIHPNPWISPNKVFNALKPLLNKNNI